jgi:hypothetical protein
MGLTAKKLRPDLVYSILLANAAMGADNVALFDAAHGNVGSGPMSADNLQSLLTLMGKQRLGRANDAAAKKRPLNIRGRYVLVPQDLWFKTDIIVTSAQRLIAADSGGTKNPLASYGLTVVADDRLGLNGCWDPSAETVRAGSATNYFVAAKPGEEGAKTIEVGYLRGTGRVPQLRPFIRTEGEWGVGWDIAMYIGAKALDHKGFAKSPGT